MRTASRLVVSAAVLGGGLLLSGPASAQEACPYPFDPADVRCQVQGGSGGGATGDDADTSGGGASGGQGSGTVVDYSPVRTTAGGSGGAATLPFTGGEVTLIALAGAAAIGGGVVLVSAGRARKTV